MAAAKFSVNCAGLTKAGARRPSDAETKRRQPSLDAVDGSCVPRVGLYAAIQSAWDTVIQLNLQRNWIRVHNA